MQAMAQTFLKNVDRQAHEFARADLSITVEPQHMMAAMLDQMASAFVFNQMVSEKLNALNAEVEALRRAIKPAIVPQA